jgi:hypothetical protein
MLGGPVSLAVARVPWFPRAGSPARPGALLAPTAANGGAVLSLTCISLHR